MNRRPRESRSNGGLGRLLPFTCSPALFFRLGRKNRGDRTAIELFSEDVRGWGSIIVSAVKQLT